MQAPALLPLEERSSRRWTPDLHLIVELPPWYQGFFSNFRECLRRAEPAPLTLTSAPAPFWPDVFVKRGLPWGRFLESAVYHVIGFALLLGFSRFLQLQPQPTVAPIFNRAQVIYYQPAEYLPPLDTRVDDPAPPGQADPELSKQQIISVPREADNRSQTVVAPPNVRLKRDVASPNIVAWTDKPDLPIAPAPLVPAASLSRINPQVEASVVAPPPDLAAQSKAAFQAPQPSVIEPPPSVATASARPPGEINMARAAVIAPAPQLSVSEQQAISAAALGPTGLVPLIVPPPPSLAGSSSSTGGGRVIVLNVHPSVGAPPVAPPGNRRGTFATTPEGHAGASGNPGTSSGTVSGANGLGSRNRSGAKASGDIPAGLYVSKAGEAAEAGPVAGDPAPKGAAPTPSVNSKLMASVPPPRVAKAPPRFLQPEAETRLSETERALFGTRRFYSLTLNTPNLNSAGGSWVIRFAELKQGSSGDPAGLSAPTATRTVDPAYPLELMRQNLAGTVIIYAVIRGDGTVANVRVLQSVDDRLDQFASEAVARWQFQPATRNGVAVDVEATFHVPFRPARPNF